MKEAFTTPIFFYGTLLDPKTRMEALGRHLEGRKASLRGWWKKDDKGYPYLEKHDTGIVNGEVFDCIPADVAHLDKWEKKYRRMKVKLSDGTVAQVYEEAGH